MPSYSQIGTAKGVSQGAGRIGQALLQLISMREDRARQKQEQSYLEDQMSFRREQEKADQAYRARTLDMQAEANEARTAEKYNEMRLQGWTPDTMEVTPPQPQMGAPAPSARPSGIGMSGGARGPSGMGMAPQGPSGKDLLGLISGSAPTALQPGAGMRVKPGGYDPSRDIGLQSRLAQETAGAGATAERDERLHGYDMEEIRAQGAENRQTFAARPTAASGGLDVTDLPVGVQQAMVGSQAAMSALANYEGLARRYFEVPRAGRALSNMGAPAGQATDALAGQLQSAQRALMMELKELANLGVLNGPDLELMQQMIGDPTTMTSVVRDPEYTLQRIGEARRFIEGRMQAYQQTYGATPTPAPSPAPPAPGGDVSRPMNPWR